MFGCAKRKIVNSLTQLFEKQKPVLDQVLENSDLSISLRYEIDVLIDFIVPKESNQVYPILNQILDYALPLNKKQINKNLILRRNAANLLSTICTKLQTRIKETGLLKKRIENFIIKDNSFINEQKEFAGHFQRIVECFLRFEIRNENKHPFDDCKTFLGNVISKIHILAYRFLAINLFSDFIEIFSDNNSEQNIMKIASKIIVTYISHGKDSTFRYNLISMLFQIYQQNDDIFVSFNVNYLPFLFDAALSLPKENQLHIFESFRIISLLIAQLDSQKVNPIIDAYVEKRKKIIYNFAKSDISIFCSVFRVFWKFLLECGNFQGEAIRLFFDDPYNEPKYQVNWYFYIKFVDIFSKLDAKTKYNYVRAFGIVKRAILYMEKLKKKSLQPNFCILRLIDIIAQPLKDNEYSLSIDPSEEKNPMLTNEWVQAVFEAKTILVKERDAVEFAKKDFIERDDFM